MKAWNGHLAMLMRRELWEHRALWRAPLAVVAGVVLLSLIGPNSFGPGEGPMGMVDVRAPVDVALLFGRGVMTVLTTAWAVRISVSRSCMRRRTRPKSPLLRTTNVVTKMTICAITTGIETPRVSSSDGASPDARSADSID